LLNRYSAWMRCNGELTVKKAQFNSTNGIDGVTREFVTFVTL
jgi:hypothetical protein